MLRHIANKRTRIDVMIRHCAHRLRRALCWPQQSKEEFDGRALARAVWPQQAGNPVADRKIDRIQRYDAAVVF